MGWLVLLGGVVLGLGACGEDVATRAEGPARVVVSIPPLAGLVREALPAGSEVRVLIPAGVSPHAFAPKASDLAALRRADLVILNGLGVEAGLAAMLRSTDHAFREEIVFAEVVDIEGDGHDHDDAHDDDEGLDPHLWLDPSLARLLIERVGSWEREDGGGSDSRRSVRAQRVRLLLARIDEVDTANRERLAPFQGHRVITDHRAWDRLFERYAIEVAGVIRPIEHVEPSAGVLARVIETIHESDVRAVFVEPQFARGPAERIAEATGVPIGRLDPLGQGDWYAMMEANLDEIVRTLERGEPGGP